MRCQESVHFIKEGMLEIHRCMLSAVHSGQCKCNCGDYFMSDIRLLQWRKSAGITTTTQAPKRQTRKWISSLKAAKLPPIRRANK